jgi:hypothetical protein
LALTFNGYAVSGGVPIGVRVGLPVLVAVRVRVPVRVVVAVRVAVGVRDAVLVRVGVWSPMGAASHHRFMRVGGGARRHARGDNVTVRVA